MARPVFTSSVGVIYNLQVDVDFQNATPTIPDSSAGVPVNVLVWGVGLWGQSVWGSSPTIQAQWQSVGNIGYAAAFHMAGQSVSAFDLHSVDLMFEPGGPL